MPQYTYVVSPFLFLMNQFEKSMKFSIFMNKLKVSKNEKSFLLIMNQLSKQIIKIVRNPDVNHQ